MSHYLKSSHIVVKVHLSTVAVPPSLILKYFRACSAKLSLRQLFSTSLLQMSDNLLMEGLATLLLRRFIGKTRENGSAELPFLGRIIAVKHLSIIFSLYNGLLSRNSLHKIYTFPHIFDLMQ